MDALRRSLVILLAVTAVICIVPMTSDASDAAGEMDGLMLYEVNPWDDHEGVSVHNYGDGSVDLKNYIISDNPNLSRTEGYITFSESIIVNPGETVAVASASGGDCNYINRDDVTIYYIGSNGMVKNVVLKHVQIASDYQNAYVGGVAGNNDGAIENCSVSGSVSGNSNSGGTYNCVGGIVGNQWSGSITRCSSSATVNGTGGVGGVVGQTNFGATLTACYATGNVTLESNNSNSTYAGGVVGSNGGSSTLIACYATGNVTGTGTGTGSIYVGGVTGDNALGTLTACYHATGDVTGASESTGGVAGRNFKDSMFGGGIITACYWNGTVTGDNGIGNDMVGNGKATKVEGSMTWETAMNAMNSALESNGSEWRYELTGALPTLKKQ